jgi:hypothetical protein
MRFTTQTSVRAGLAVAAVAGLAVSGMTGAAAAPRKAALYERPYLDVKITDSKLVAHSGGGAFATGQMDLSLEAVGGDRGVQVVQFAAGYGFRDFRDDLRTAYSNLFAPDGDQKKGLKAFNHAINHTTYAGGLFSPQGHIRRGTLLLGEEGTYVVYDDSHGLPRHPERFEISGSVGPQHLPPSGGTITARTDRRFGGDDVLPAKGNIKFVNRSTQSPHFLALNHVKEGTTRKDVMDYFESGAEGEPSFALKGEAGTDVLGYGEKQNLHVNLPPGQYVELCFFLDPDEGMPHAFMGMIRMVHLK